MTITPRTFTVGVLLSLATDSPSGAHGAGATYSNITASRGHQGSHDSHGHLPASDIVSNPFANYHHGRGGGKDGELIEIELLPLAAEGMGKRNGME